MLKLISWQIVLYILYQKDSLLANLQFWSVFEKIQKACPEITFRPNEMAYRWLIFNDLSAKDKRNLFAYIQEEFKGCAFTNITNVIREMRDTQISSAIMKATQWSKEKTLEMLKIFGKKTIKEYCKEYKTFFNDYYDLKQAYAQMREYNSANRYNLDLLYYMFKWSKEYKIEIPWKKGNDIVLDYIKMETTVNAIKDKKTNKVLEKYAEEMREKLYFSDENYEVVIPKCVEDFRKESDQQKNCVLRCYLEPTVSRRTNIVFIRSKSNLEKSVVTCEVRCNGEIWQYLSACNSTPSSPLLEFKKKYQAFLKQTFQE